MIKLLKTSTIQALKDEAQDKSNQLQALNDIIENMEQELSEAREEYEDLSRDHAELQDEYTNSLKTKNEELHQLTERVKNLSEHISQESDKNSVTLEFEDDLTQVHPYVRYKSESFEKFAELGYLDDTQFGNNSAMQLACLMVAFEALQQLVSAFEKE